MSFAKLGAAVGSIWGPGGAAIGAGLGSFADAEVASEKARKKAKFNHLAKLRKDAEAAGFNPLTALRATGGQGFSHGASGAMASASFWSSFANSAGQIAGQFDPHKREMQRLDRDIAGATFDGMMIDQGIAIDRDLRDAQRLELDRKRLKLDIMQAGEGTYSNPIESSVWYILPDGTKTLGPNPDGGEIENMLLTPTLATGATFTADAPNTSRMKRDGLTAPALERQPYVQ